MESKKVSEMKNNIYQIYRCGMIEQSILDGLCISVEERLNEVTTLEELKGVMKQFKITKDKIERLNYYKNI